ncbi:DNA-binding protein [Methylobacterium sp. V23]|uniref:DNA-binding protein n=1 Tax=Methylobacterium sp. V23 TaxID=2044878 RepID=UPI0015E18C4C|nr:DNA-binding protein [Methylobacterium sp. V23]
MPDKDKVWYAANEVRRSGERVSQRNVIKVLQRRGRGGTSREVGPHLLTWMVKYGYDARLEVNDIPDRLKGDLVGFVRGVWEEAMIEATGRLEAERARTAVECQAARTLMDEAYGEAEVATRQNEVLRARVAELEAEVEPLRAARTKLEGDVVTLRKQVSDVEAAEFWDRVMRAIQGVLPQNEWVADKDVLRLLPETLAKEADKSGRPLTRGRLNRKMVVRVTHGKYFELDEQEGGGKRYRRAPG